MSPLERFMLCKLKNLSFLSEYKCTQRYYIKRYRDINTMQGYQAFYNFVAPTSLLIILKKLPFSHLLLRKLRLILGRVIHTMFYWPLARYSSKEWIFLHFTTFWMKCFSKLPNRLTSLIFKNSKIQNISFYCINVQYNFFHKLNSDRLITLSIFQWRQHKFLSLLQTRTDDPQ